MRNEFNKIGREFSRTDEHHLPRDPDQITFEEIAPPADEFAPCAPELSDLNTPQEATEGTPQAEAKAKKTKKKLHEKLVRQMSYLTVTAVALVTMSNTLGFDILDNVISAGGSVRGDLRFSIQWNDRQRNSNDFDAHCVEPSGYEVFFGTQSQVSPSGGTLDVDITYPTTETAVENIIYDSRRGMEEGTYRLFVHNYAHNGGKSGFSAQVAIQGRVYDFKYDHELAPGEIVQVAEVTLQNGSFSLKKLLN